MRCYLLAIGILSLSACSVDNGSPSAAPTATSTEGRFTKEDFASYLDALRAHDYDGFTSYYTPDVKLTMSENVVLDRAGIIDMERGLADVWDWTMEVHQTVLDESGAAILVTMAGPFLKDAADLLGASPKAGERWRMDFSMFYVLRNGKIAEVRAGPAVFARQP